LILTSIGGYFDDLFKICNFIKKRTGKFNVTVSDHACSCATVLCLAANKLIMMKNSYIGAMNPIVEISFNDSPMTFDFEVGDIIQYLKNNKSILKDEHIGYQQNILNYINEQGLSYFENKQNQIRSDIKKIINPIYNIDNILKHMFDNISSHNDLFTINDLAKFTGAKTRMINTTI